MITKTKRLKKFWSEKVLPNKGKIASRVIKAGAVYALTGPAIAMAVNGSAVSDIATALSEDYMGMVQSCLGGKKLMGFIPAPKSYLEGTICAALLLTCGAAAAQGFGNGLTDAACIALVRSLSAQNPA